MQKSPPHRSLLPIPGLALLVAACLWAETLASSPPATEIDGEIRYYREVTGARVKKVAWQLSQGDNFTLTYISPSERHVTTTGPAYDTRSWKVTVPDDRTAFVARRDGRTVVIQGMYKGEPLDRTLAIDEAPWYQATSLSLRGLAASDDAERLFWTIRLETLSAHKIKAIKKGIESVASDGSPMTLQRIRLTLTGLLAPFWKSDYWFTVPENIFFRFEGPSGPPGSPKTVVTLIAGQVGGY